MIIRQTMLLKLNVGLDSFAKPYLLNSLFFLNNNNNNNNNNYNNDYNTINVTSTTTSTTSTKSTTITMAATTTTTSKAATTETATTAMGSATPFFGYSNASNFCHMWEKLFPAAAK